VATGDTNTYISAHRLGWPGTASYHRFYNLPLLACGDKIYLYDANGTTYTYQVTEIFEVWPTETSVTEPAPGRDIISMQACIEN
jgi:sortase A